MVHVVMSSRCALIQSTQQLQCQQRSQSARRTAWLVPTLMSVAVVPAAMSLKCALIQSTHQAPRRLNRPELLHMLPPRHPPRLQPKHPQWLRLTTQLSRPLRLPPTPRPTAQRLHLPHTQLLHLEHRLWHPPLHLPLWRLLGHPPWHRQITQPGHPQWLLPILRPRHPQIILPRSQRLTPLRPQEHQR